MEKKPSRIQGGGRRVFVKMIRHCRANFSARNKSPFFFLFLLFSVSFIHSVNVGALGHASSVTASSVLQPQQSATAPNTEAIVLEVGKAIEREIKGGQTQTYQITLNAGQFASATVQQRGIDVVVRLFAPDGKLIDEVDSESRPHGQETLEVAAVTTGALRIEITPRYKFLPAGRYEIRILEVRSASERDNSLQEARRLHTQARREYLAGRYNEAISLEHQVLSIRQQILNSEHPDVASSLFALGLYYRNAGDIPEAEDSYLRALAIREKVLGPDHPDVSFVLHNLGYLYYSDLRDYVQAQSMYERSLAIKEKAFGEEHPVVAMTLNNIGLVQWKEKDYARAAASFQRALEIIEKSEGPESELAATSIHNLGIIYKENGDYSKGEAYYRQALHIWEKVLGKEHPRVAFALESLGILYRDKGDYQNAEPFLQRAIDIEVKTEGANHPDVANTLVILARLYEAKGDIARAVECQSRAAAIEEKNISLNLSLGSERQKLAYFSSMMKEGERRVSLHVRSAPDDPHARDLALTMLLQRKGRVLDALTDTKAVLRRRLSAQDQTLVDNLNELTARLSRLVFDGPSGEPASEHEKTVKGLEAQRDQLEEELSRRSAGLYQPSQSQPVTLDAIRKVLPENAALIEFAVYHPSDPKVAVEHDTPTAPRYVAYVIRNRDEVKWKELGPAKDIDSAIDAFRQALSDPQRRDVQQLARSVDEKVMQPLSPLLGDAKQLLVSPDGDLNLVPFAALADEHGHYLLEHYSLTYLTSGRDLLRLQVPRESKGPPVIIADPAFGAPALMASSGRAGVTTGAGINSRPQVDYSQIFFGPLPGVTEEVHALKALLPQATFFTRDEATKAAMKKLSGPSILHVATHGFFLQDEPSATAVNHPATQAKDETRLAKWVVHVDNPLLRSGLALAGANQSGNGNTDGILTALEAAELDLWGTKLVVLSACDTGIGEVRNGEGVYGLRRALVLAGAASQIMSLWAVSDRSTRDLIIGYYKALSQGAGRGEALREVQLQMLRDKAHRHPYYWAGFIQTGEWANLEGKR